MIRPFAWTFAIEVGRRTAWRPRRYVFGNCKGYGWLCFWFERRWDHE